jgi:hypothetical protein
VEEYQAQQEHDRGLGIKTKYRRMRYLRLAYLYFQRLTDGRLQQIRELSVNAERAAHSLFLGHLSALGSDAVEMLLQPLDDFFAFGIVRLAHQFF